MKSSIAATLAGYFVLRSGGTVAYSAMSLPPPRLAPVTPISSTMTTRTHLAYYADTDDLGGEELLQMKSVLGRVFRRGKNRLQTLEKETVAAKKRKDPEELWRVMFHNSEYMPERVAGVLTKVFPISRRAAFDICVQARSTGTVVVTVTNKKQAEKYCGALLRRGLTATIEPHVM